jgi:pimeloyl-ACP methyl ester carboxylesterase
VWANNVADLSTNRRVYALDMMGQPGKSIPDQPVRNRAEMVEWLNSVLDYFEIGRADLVGYPYGGFAALNYAARAPDRVNALVILSPAGGLVPLRVQMYIRGALNTLTGAFLPGLTRYTMRSLFRWMFYKPNLRRAEIRPVADCIFTQMLLGTRHFHQEHLSPKNFVLPGICSDEELRAIRSPTLLLIGQQESLYNAAAAITRARQLITKIQAEIIPDAGHDLPVSKAKVVDQKVLAFLGDYD